MKWAREPLSVTKITIIVSLMIVLCVAAFLSCKAYFRRVDWIITRGLKTQSGEVWPFVGLFDMYHAIQEAENDVCPLLFERFRMSSSETEKCRLIRAIGARGDAAYVPQLIEVISAETEETQIKCIGYWALGMIGDESALPFLRQQALVRSRLSIIAAKSAAFISGTKEQFVPWKGTLLYAYPDREINGRVDSLKRAREVFQATGKETTYINPETGMKSVYRGFQRRSDSQR